VEGEASQGDARGPHSLHTAEVTGSIPVTPTNHSPCSDSTPHPPASVAVSGLAPSGSTRAATAGMTSSRASLQRRWPDATGCVAGYESQFAYCSWVLRMRQVASEAGRGGPMLRLLAEEGSGAKGVKPALARGALLVVGHLAAIVVLPPATNVARPRHPPSHSHAHHASLRTAGALLSSAQMDGD
jgi:hypothetical protein